MNRKQILNKYHLTRFTIFLAGLILVISAFYGVFTVYPACAPVNGRPALRIGFYGYDYPSGTLGLLLIIVGVKIRSSTITRE